MPLNKANLAESEEVFDDDLPWGDEVAEDTDETAVAEAANAPDDTPDTVVQIEEVEEVEEVEAPAQVTEPAQAQVTEPAPAPSGGQMAAVGGGGAMAALANDGFGEVELGFGSFPIVTLKDNFQAGETEIGTEFEAILLNARPKFIYKISDDEFVYTHDQKVTTKGEDLEGIIARWKQRSLQHQVRSYKDVTASVQSGPLTGQIVLMSVPQTSVQRLDGYRVTLAVQRQLKLPQVVTKVSRGAKVTKVRYPFYPWDFSYLREA